MHWMLTGLRAAARGLPPTLTPDQTVFCHTADGWTLPLRRYGGVGPPVLLVHGMGVNHYNWDFRPEISLADHLRAEGWDVWVASLRGDPDTVPPDAGAPRRFDFDDHALLDVPTIVDTVLERTGHSALAWVGHSMGGMLLYAALTERPAQILAGVAICAPVTFRAQRASHRLAGRVGPRLLNGPGLVRRRRLAKTLATVGPMLALKRLANPVHVELPMLRGLAMHASVDLPKPMLRQAAQWARSGMFHRRDGTPWLPVDRRIEGPALRVFGGTGDRLVPAANVAAAAEVFAGCTYVELGRAHGLSRDYGHIDPVIGRLAREEVYPLVSSWLRPFQRP